MTEQEEIRILSNEVKVLQNIIFILEIQLDKHKEKVKMKAKRIEDLVEEKVKAV